MIVVDASVLAVALADDDRDGDVARARLSGEDSLHAPELIYAEVVSVWRRHVRSGFLPERRARLALEDLAALPLRAYPHKALVGTAWSLRDNLTVYDALYASLAAVLECPLLTGDAHLAQAPGLPCAVEVFSPDGGGDR